MARRRARMSATPPGGCSRGNVRGARSTDHHSCGDAARHSSHRSRGSGTGSVQPMGQAMSHSEKPGCRRTAHLLSSHREIGHLPVAAMRSSEGRPREVTLLPPPLPDDP